MEVGHPVLRDYVGVVVAGLGGICPAAVDGVAYQALRLGPADAQGDRDVQAFTRKFNKNTNALVSTTNRCRPAGALTLVDLDGVEHHLDLRAVTQILFAWSASPLPLTSAKPGG